MDNNDLFSEEFELLKELIFIGNIPKKTKVNMSDRSVVSDTSLYGSIKRRWLDEDRSKTLNEIKNIINSVLKILPTIEPAWKKEMFIQSLLESKKGLINLKNTYNCDINISSAYDIIIKTIDNTISELEKNETM